MPRAGPLPRHTARASCLRQVSGPLLTAQDQGKGQPSARDGIPQNEPGHVAGKARSSGPGRKAAEVRESGPVSRVQVLRGQRGSHLCRDLRETALRVQKTRRPATDTWHLDTRGLLPAGPRRQTLPLPPRNAPGQDAVSVTDEDPALLPADRPIPNGIPGPVDRPLDQARPGVPTLQSKSASGSRPTQNVNTATDFQRIPKHVNARRNPKFHSVFTAAECHR